MGIRERHNCPYDDPDCFNCPFEECTVTDADLKRQIAFNAQKKKAMKGEGALIKSVGGKRFG